MGRSEDLTGQKYGRWLVVGKADRPRYWRCICECGTQKDVLASSFLRGVSKSCGCYNREITRKRHLTHGESGTPLYHVWHGMLQRCYYDKHIDRQWYSDLNIDVCEEWRHDYAAFRDWMVENGYEVGMTLDRIDNTKGYCPENCRLVTPREQACNRRSNIMIDYNGKVQPLKIWAEELDINYHTLYRRIKKGLPFEAAICM